MTQPASSKIKDLLLSSEEMSAKYKELGEDYSYPYFYRIAKNGQALYFLGSQHLLNPEDSGFKPIRKYWNEFLDETGTDNCIVLIEAWEDLKDKALEHPTRWGEPGYTTFLAIKEGVEVISPEPDRWEVRSQLLERFSKDEIFYSDFAGIAYQWSRLKDKPSFEEYINNYLEIYREESGWNDYDFSFENFKRIHNETHDHEFNENDSSCFYEDFSPVTNKVSRMEGLIRDIYIVSEIKRRWDEGKNIFIVYGSGHAIVQEPALKELLK